jgi:hypothetical protein
MTVYSGLLSDYVGAGVIADRPVTPTGYNPDVGVSWFATDTGVLSEWDGTAWVDITAPNGLPTGGTTGQVLTKDSGTDFDVSWQTPGGGSGGGGFWDISAGVPPATDFTSVNLQSGTTFGESAGKALWLKGVNNGLQYIHTPAPTPPYRVMMLVQTMFIGGDSWPFFGWRDTGSTKFQMMLLPRADNANVQAYDSQTDMQWIGLEDDGTNFKFQFSIDGVNVINLYSAAKSGGFLGSSGYDNILFGVRGNDSLPYIGTLRCYDENGLTRTFP